MWASAIGSGNGAAVLQLLIEEASKVPYKLKKSHGAHNDSEFIQSLLQGMNDILHHQFLHVDFSSPTRDVEKAVWADVVACRRSDSGTTGTYFIQTQISRDDIKEIVVAKPVSLADFQKNVFVNEVSNRYFHIRCPRIRFVTAEDPEFTAIHDAIKALYLPLNEELYEMGGHHSPKALFGGKGLMLMEFVKGKPLCHRSQGQRALTFADYFALGKLFLLDLLIRNTDRLPCAKAMPRPGSRIIEDHGNAGNILFGDKPGEMWSIDPEMLTQVESHIEETYGAAFESVLQEMLHHEAEDERYIAINNLFYSTNPGLAGVLDISLNDSYRWTKFTSLEKAGAGLLLQMIRLQAKADDVIIRRTNGVEPPVNDDEKEWREWIRLAVPRAVLDVLHFLEVHTGYATPPFAARAFESGFLESLMEATNFQEEFEHPSDLASKQSRFFLLSHAQNEPSIDIEFILRMIRRSRKHINKPELVRRVTKNQRAAFQNQQRDGGDWEKDLTASASVDSDTNNVVSPVISTQDVL